MLIHALHATCLAVNKRWSDFLFAIGVRLLCGLILGALAGVLFGWRLILRQAARDNVRSIGLWLVALERWRRSHRNASDPSLASTVVQGRFRF